MLFGTREGCCLAGMRMRWVRVKRCGRLCSLLLSLHRSQGLHIRLGKDGADCSRRLSLRGACQSFCALDVKLMVASICWRLKGAEGTFRAVSCRMGPSRSHAVRAPRPRRWKQRGTQLHAFWVSDSASPCSSFLLDPVRDVLANATPAPVILF